MQHQLLEAGLLNAPVLITIVPAEVVSELTKVAKLQLPLQAGCCKVVCNTYSSRIYQISTSRELLPSNGRDEISNRSVQIEQTCNSCVRPVGAALLGVLESSGISDR